MTSIILTGGGTAGHCTPNLALIPHLKKHFDKIYYIGSKNGIERQLVAKYNLEYISIDCTKLKREISLDNLKIPFILFRGINQAKKAIKEINPSVVFSKGGYVSLPVVIACKKLNIPVITHESDLTIGLANRISAKYCSLVLTSFPETAQKIKNGRHVGPPLKGEKIEKNVNTIKQKYQIYNKKPIILVTGGSQGAKSINQSVREILPLLLNEFNIIHLCGKNNTDKSINKDGYLQIEYTQEINELYAIASICISRAGSNTIFELLNANVPTLLIPLPKNVSRGDQILNAEYFYKKGATNLLLQENMNSNTLLKKILKTYENSDKLKANMKKLNITDSCPIIAEILSEYAKNS